MNLFAQTTAIALIAAPVLADTPGHRAFSVPAAHRDGDLDAALFYPAAEGPISRIGDNIIFHGRDIRADAPATGSDLPLVVVSHGSGGNMLGLTWLGAGLAEAGAIVLMMNHPGSTSRDSYPTQTAYLDRRTDDLSAALDAVLADPEWAGRIDTDRISVLGFSLGGGTALQMGGARFESQRYRAFCETYAEQATGCDWMQSDGFNLMDWPASAEADLRDDRISRVMAFDPAFGFSWDPDSLAASDAPTLLVNLGPTGFGSEWFGVGVGPDAADLPAIMPDTTYAVIDDSWHFSFLPECRFYAPLLIWWEGEDPICSDPWGSDRGRVHQRIVSMASDFIGLDPAIGPQSGS